MNLSTSKHTGSTGDPAATVLERARALVEDLHYERARQWKDERPGRLAVGHMPVWVPRPLFESIEVLPVALYGGGDRLDVVRGDSLFQSYICHIPRSVVEMGMGGYLDGLDGVIFPSTCDVIRNLGGMWKTLFADKWVAYLDLPQNFDPRIGGAFLRSELERLANELTERGARELNDAALEQALRTENRRWQLLERLAQLRIDEPGRVSVSEAYLVTRAGSVIPAAEHIEMLEAFLDAIASRPARTYDNVRVGVVGAFCEQPPLALLRTLERAGCDVVFDDLQQGLTYLRRPYEEGTGDPLGAVVDAWLERAGVAASRFATPEQRGEALVERVRKAGADGVIFAAPSFCDPALLDQPMLEEALKKAGIPYTAFKYSENSAQYHAIGEQAGAFSDAVKLWGATA